MMGGGGGGEEVFLMTGGAADVTPPPHPLCLPPRQTCLQTVKAEILHQSTIIQLEQRA